MFAVRISSQGATGSPVEVGSLSPFYDGFQKHGKRCLGFKVTPFRCQAVVFLLPEPLHKDAWEKIFGALSNQGLGEVDSRDW